MLYLMCDRKHVKVSKVWHEWMCICFFIVLFFFFKSGWFLLSSSQHLSRSSVAHVLSEWIHLRETVCFSLWYHMNSRSEKRKKTKLCIAALPDEGCFCLSCLVSPLASWGSVKCHLVLNHLLLCARVICVRVETRQISCLTEDSGQTWTLL